MKSEFREAMEVARNAYGEAFAPRGESAFSVVVNGAAVSFAAVPGEPATAVVRTKVCDTAGLSNRGGMAVAALSGNFFWSGAGGATLSFDGGDALWLTERRPVAEISDADGLAECVKDFIDNASDWRERSGLYA